MARTRIFPLSIGLILGNFISRCIQYVYTVCDMSHKRVQVTFTEEQWALIANFRGEMGNGDSEIIRNIVLAWLSEKSFISDSVKEKLSEKP